MLFLFLSLRISRFHRLVKNIGGATKIFGERKVAIIFGESAQATIPKVYPLSDIITLILDKNILFIFFHNPFNCKSRMQS